MAIKEVFEPDNFIIQKLINREVEILKSIRHPNIVQFMGLCCHSSGIYIVTEFVPGGHLWKVLKDKELHLSWSVRVQMATDIAQAMNYLHRRKLLHRDLKTKNLLVDVNYRIKVCDFGFARTTENEKDDKYMTKTGTSLWMAPEMYVQHKTTTTTTTTHLYSLFPTFFLFFLKKKKVLGSTLFSQSRCLFLWCDPSRDHHQETTSGPFCCRGLWVHSCSLHGRHSC